MSVKKLTTLGLLKSAELSEKEKSNARQLGLLTGGGAGLGAAVNSYLVSKALSDQMNAKADETQALARRNAEKVYKALAGDKPSGLRKALADRLTNRVLTGKAVPGDPDFSVVAQEMRDIVKKVPTKKLVGAAAAQGVLLGLPIGVATTLGARKLMSDTAESKNKQIRGKDDVIKRLKSYMAPNPEPKPE